MNVQKGHIILYKQKDIINVYLAIKNCGECSEKETYDSSNKLINMNCLKCKKKSGTNEEKVNINVLQKNQIIIMF